MDPFESRNQVIEPPAESMNRESEICVADEHAESSSSENRLKNTKHRTSRSNTEQDRGMEIRPEPEVVTDGMNTSFREDRFFKFPSFTSAEMREAEDRIFSPLETSLCALEAEGCASFFKNLEEIATAKRNTREAALDSVQYVMNDARINEDHRENMEETATAKRNKPEASIDRVQQSMIDARINEGPREIMEVLTLPAELAAVEAGCYEAHNGGADLHSARSLLHRYALSGPVLLSSNKPPFAHMPIYEENRIKLPAHLPSAYRIVELPEKYRNASKKEKQRFLSLMAIVRLHSLKVIDDRLLPLSEKGVQTQIFRVGARGSSGPVVPNKLPLEKLYGTADVNAFISPILQESETVENFRRGFEGKGHQLAFISLQRSSFSFPHLNLQHKEFGPITLSLGEKIPINVSAEQRSILKQVFVILMDERWRRRSRKMFFAVRPEEEYLSPILPYLIGIQTAEGNLDWILMQLLIREAARSKDERIAAARSKISGSSEARICAPIYDELIPYVALEVTEETCVSAFHARKEGVETFQDYFLKCCNFEVRAESSLFKAQKLWSLPRNLPLCSESSGTDDTRQRSNTESCSPYEVKLAQDACLELRLANADIALLCLMLPQFLYVYEHYANARAFIEHCRVHLPVLGDQLSRMPLRKVAMSLTASSCGLPDSYEMMEFFGDAVLKMVQTDVLIKSIELQSWVDVLDEGGLSTLRSSMGSNERLGQICRHFMLQKFIFAAKLERGKWLPSSMTFKQGTKLQHNDELSSKVYADVVEAVVGLVFLEGGWDVTIKVADELNLTVPWSDTRHRKSNFEDVNPALLTLAQSCTGYSHFNRKEVAKEALTHPSAQSVDVPSYERLEWIGDAVLCMAVRTWIYNNFKEESSLSELVEVEAALVSNETLAFLAVRYGLQHHLNHSDPSLPSHIEKYTRSVSESDNGLWVNNPPKAVSDIAESTLGAIHEDGGFAAGQRACLHFMSPVLNLLLKAKQSKKKIRLKHPIKAFHEIAGDLIELHVDSAFDFASAAPDVEVLAESGEWGVSKAEDSFVGSIQILGSILIAVLDSSSKVAKNKVCALFVCTMERNPTLCDRLQNSVKMIGRAQAHRPHAHA